MTKNCQKSFDLGKANRELNPLRARGYKLTESYGTWRRRYDALNVIESALEDKIKIPADYELGGWTGADWPTELERLPEDLAEDLGYRILPGVLSLCDYAKATPETATLAARVEKKASNIVNTCERYRPSITRPTKRYNATIKRISSARYLVIQVLMMIEDSFAVANVPLSLR
ncbi:hypothetical protein N9C18_01295 [Planktomarina temperata]|nr:hypothetical protein [Planktomarina temperata]